MNSTPEQPILPLELPAPHILSRMVDARETYFLAARGTWKTTRAISLFVIDKVYQMPRSSGVIVGLSFEHLGDNTIPPMLHAWDEFGLRHGDHYVIGQRPPDHWPKSFLGVTNGKYDHTITFHNGTIIHLVSLKKKASANGISAQWGVFDEAKFMKEKNLVDEIFPIFRGNEKHFSHLGGYLSKMFATDKLADPHQVEWLLNKKKLNDPRKIAVVITLQQELSKIKLQLQDAATGKNLGKTLKAQANAIETRLHKLRASMVFYVEANAIDVLPAMGEQWLKDKQRNMGQHEFDVSIMNKNPDRPGESFYPAWGPQMLHANPYDINPVKPLIIASDYQHSIAPILVAQLCKLPGADGITLNYLDEVFTLAEPKDKPQENGNGKAGGLKDAVQLFCDRYKAHPTKMVYYVYDHTAVGRRVDADKYFEDVVKVLKANRWAVRKVYTGQAPLHFQKYEDCRGWMSGSDKTVTPIQINQTRCPFLVASITGAKATTINGKTEKDKQGEKDRTRDQRKTTHISDVFDQINDAALKKKMIKAKATAGARATTR